MIFIQRVGVDSLLLPSFIFWRLVIAHFRKEHQDKHLIEDYQGKYVLDWQ